MSSPKPTRTFTASKPSSRQRIAVSTTLSGPNPLAYTGMLHVRDSRAVHSRARPWALTARSHRAVSAPLIACMIGSIVPPWEPMGANSWNHVRVQRIDACSLLTYKQGSYPLADSGDSLIFSLRWIVNPPFTIIHGAVDRLCRFPKDILIRSTIGAYNILTRTLRIVRATTLEVNECRPVVFLLSPGIQALQRYQR